MANRYENGKVYKLVNGVNDDIYVGSTCLPLSKRLSAHKKDAKTDRHKHRYDLLNEIGWESVRIVLIEECKCAGKMELQQREQYHIDNLRPSLNMRRAYGASSQICPHARRRAYCADCQGSQMCEHNKKHDACCVCSPALCEACDVIVSKSSYTRHTRTVKHMTNTMV